MTIIFLKCVCHICQSTIAIPMKRNAELHEKYEIQIPANTELRKRKGKEVKSQLFFKMNELMLCWALTSTEMVESSIVF